HRRRALREVERVCRVVHLERGPRLLVDGPAGIVVVLGLLELLIGVERGLPVARGLGLLRDARDLLRRVLAFERRDLLRRDALLRRLLIVGLRGLGLRGLHLVLGVVLRVRLVVLVGLVGLVAAIELVGLVVPVGLVAAALLLARLVVR